MSANEILMKQMCTISISIKQRCAMSMQMLLLTCFFDCIVVALLHVRKTEQTTFSLWLLFSSFAALAVANILFNLLLSLELPVTWPESYVTSLSVINWEKGFALLTRKCFSSFYKLLIALIHYSFFLHLTTFTQANNLSFLNRLWAWLAIIFRLFFLTTEQTSFAFCCLSSPWLHLFFFSLLSIVSSSLAVQFAVLFAIVLSLTIEHACNHSWLILCLLSSSDQLQRQSFFVHRLF